MIQLRTLLLLVLAAATAGAQGAEPIVRLDSEIGYLVVAIQRSGCRFSRNGLEYDAAAAAEHLREKYAFVARGKPLGDTETVIERVATRSSITGRPYEVRCPGQDPVPLASWLRAALVRARASGGPGQTPESH